MKKNLNAIQSNDSQEQVTVLDFSSPKAAAATMLDAAKNIKHLINQVELDSSISLAAKRAKICELNACLDETLDLAASTADERIAA